MADDFSADINTTGTVNVNGANVNGDIETNGDHDWFKVWLWSGHTYVIKQNIVTLADPELALHNSNGTLLATNDDGGPGFASYLRYTPTANGYYYIDAGEH